MNDHDDGGMPTHLQAAEPSPARSRIPVKGDRRVVPESRAAGASGIAQQGHGAKPNANLGSLRHRWMFDWANSWEYTAHALEREIYHGHSEFQDIEIVETEAYGRCLLLDGEVQSFEADEYMYHESLVHPAMLLHPGPQRVLVIGGGEGATLREVLRHGAVQSVVMVDLDEQLIDAARRHLPTFHQGSFDDRRVRLEFGDGRRFVETCREQFDAIIIDVTNPMQDGPSFRLFTVEFYRAVRERLNPGGVVSLQSDSVTLHGLDAAATIHHTIRAIWPNVFTYAAFLPAYTTDWSFTLCSSTRIEPLRLQVDEIDRLLRDRLDSPLRFYDGITHQRLFHLPRYVRDCFAAHQTISSDSHPLCETFPGLAWNA
jgi:spermidine synthase